MRKIAVLGFGLIGGSLAAAVRRGGLGAVIAIDRKDVIETEIAAGLASERVDAADAVAVEQAFREADLGVLAMPVGAIVAALPRALRNGKTITDCGSTKRIIAQHGTAEPRSRRFVPGHPMAGAPVGGLVHARADLFAGKRWILCPEGCDADALAVVEEVVAGVGAKVVRMTAAEHDRVVAVTSHVPQVISSCLAVLGARRSALTGAGPAFVSVTERAGGGEAMWRDIFATNADEVAAVLRDVAHQLESTAASLGGHPPDLEPVMRLLGQARGSREP
ncbi:MAG: prephenate dehydrogenase/arogenate dehydrogenase family protein [Polyangiaceae bacterium]|nr:prephenate dehydrogenase/arogenate dehydrogenase family protein [Polyangiaceae bacterium]